MNILSVGWIATDFSTDITNRGPQVMNPGDFSSSATLRVPVLRETAGWIVMEFGPDIPEVIMR